MHKRGGDDLDSAGWDDPSFLGTVRAVARWRPTRGFGLFFGPSYNVLVTEQLDADRLSLATPLRTRPRKNDGSERDVDAWVWPGFQAGLRVYLN